MSENPLNLSDPRGLQGDRRTPLAPFGNGKLRLTLVLLGALGSFLASIGAASWIGERAAVRETKQAVAVMEERQSNQYGEVMRKLDEQKRDIDRLLNMLIEQRRGR